MKRLFIILFFTLLPISAQALVAPAPEVVINEIAWMGTTTSANDEWIELKNTTGEEINLANWLLKTTDGKFKVYLTGKIPAHGFYLLERTDDNSVPNSPASQIYTGALSNTGLSLELSKNSQTIIDTIAFSGGWPAGDNTTKQTMERSDAGAWQTSKEPSGTPKSENSKSETLNSKQIQKTPEVEKVYANGIIISKVMPSPEGADEENEWIELHNQNATQVSLAGWKIEDTQGTITKYTFPASAVIQGNGYFVLKRPDTKITLNNETDGLNLLWPNGKTADSVSYTDAPANQSYNYTPSGWKWSGNSKNASLPKAKKSDNNIAVASLQEASAPIKESLSGNLKDSGSNPWFLFLLALGITIALATAILLFKLKILKKSTNHVGT